MTNDQAPMTNGRALSAPSLVIGTWSLTGHWSLVIDNSSLVSKESGTKRVHIGTTNARSIRCDGVRPRVRAAQHSRTCASDAPAAPARGAVVAAAGGAGHRCDRGGDRARVRDAREPG